MAKTLIVIVIVFLIFSQAGRFGQEAIPSLCETTSQIRKCPQGLGRLFLPRSFSARAIYAGFNADQIHVEFLELLIKEISKLDVAPRLNILIPRTQEYEAHQTLKKYFDQSDFEFINIMPTSSKDTVWAQDYFELLLDTTTGKSQLVDLPYFEREGEDLPASVALYCQKELIPQANFTKAEAAPGSGDYGGNIEAITTGILAVGNNLSNETYKLIQDLSSQDFWELDVNWLETGHVDELITTLPYGKESDSCDQALLIASPQLALDIINSTPKDLKEKKNPNIPFYYLEDRWPDKYHCLYPRNQKRAECLELARANKKYQEIIDHDVNKLQELMMKKHGCKLNEERFPQLFVPLLKRVRYGTYDDRAVPLNPNSVNNIFFYPNLILAKQSFEPFQDHVDKVLRKFPFKKIYIDDKFAHELNGGIHCATNISYGCAP